MTDVATTAERVLRDHGFDLDARPPAAWRAGVSPEAFAFDQIAEAWKLGGATLAAIRERQLAERRPRCVP